MAHPHHTHPHSAHNHHSHHHDYHHVLEENQAYFSKIAAEDDNPDWVDMASRLFAATSKVYPFNKETTKVMDFACGTGAFSLFPSLDRIIIIQ